MSSCIFDINNLLNSLKNLKRDIFKRILSIKKALPIEEKKRQALKEVSELGESYLINSSTIDAALEAFGGKTLTILGEAVPSKEELREAMLSWKKTPIKESEDTSTKRLDNQEKNPQRIIEDPINYYYGRALRAKIRAQQHANTVGIHSILYNENGIINNTIELNAAIKYEQEKLLENIIKYLEGQGITYFSGRKMYGENNLYTGILEEILNRVGGLFKFDFNELNGMYNNGRFDDLDAISSWVILNNFDVILKQTFGKAIDINPDKSKYSIGKYSVGGGSNVYTTWRTNEEIDLSKEINNISKAIITSLPYYLADLTVPSNNRNLKFNEFLYLISKIKDIPIHINEDFVFSSNLGIKLSPEAMKFFEGKSVFSVINTLRENPQEKIPYLIELLNNENAFNIINEKLGRNYFENIDREIINTLYLGLFNKYNPTSLIFLQEKNGFNKTNYFAFITLTIDSIYKSNFLLYFRNSDGELYVRPMYDLSISRIESDITRGINRLNSKIMTDTYLYFHEKYNTRDDVPEIFDYNKLETTLTYIPVDGTTYQIAKNGETFTIKDPEGKDVIDKNILSKINLKAKETFSVPQIIKYTIKDFHAGPLEVEINLNDGKILYLVDGKNYQFLTKKDYDSLSYIILDVLKLNFDIDNDYLIAFGDRLAVKGTGFYGALSQNLMQLVSRVITNQYIQYNYMKEVTPVTAKTRIDKIYKSNIGKPTYNKSEGELNFITDSETSIIKNLAQAKALITGRLTSSLILDGENNALASSNLSRLSSSLLYQVDTLVKQPNSAASDFSLWKSGVYKGVSQLKEYKDGNSSKSHTKFSSKEIENALIFVDFLQGITTVGSTKSPYTDGIVGFYPSENSDKTFIGRLLIDLKNVKIGESNLYDLIKDNPSNIKEFWPVILLELGDFYRKALYNINSEWARVGQELGINISYGHWEELNELAEQETLSRGKEITPIELVKEVVTNYNFNNPFNPIVLTEEVHYVQGKNGTLMINNSFLANLDRFSSLTNFSNFMYELENDVLETLLLDGLLVEATPEIKKLLGNEWIDPYTNKVILAKLYDPISGEFVGDIRKYSELDRNNPYIKINPLISAYNSLNYFFTQEYMNSSVGAYYAHPNKKAEDIGEKLANGEISEEQATLMYLADEAARKLALDKRNVSFTAAMHEFQLNLIHGIPSEINVAAMPDPKDYFETISGDSFDIKPYDGATFTNPFFQILQNYSLCGARVGLIKKTFTHYYNEKTGTGGIIKTAEFPLTNEFIRRSRFYEIMMLNMTDRVWRELNGLLSQIDITKDYNKNNIDFRNSDSVDGTTYYLDSITGEYYAFTIQSLGNNKYLRIILRIDKYGIPAEEAHPETDNDGNNIIWTVDTNYKLWKLLGGERSMAFNKGKFFLSEYSINQTVKIMNNTGTILSEDKKVRFLKDLWLPLKHSDIHLMPTAGAVKLGIANVNNISTYYNADASKINHMRIKMNQVGVLLDKEHHADGEDLSIMTLVLSACAARGYTQELCQLLYNAMASLAKAGIRPYLKSFEEFFKVSVNENATPELLEEARQKFENTLLDTLIKALANSTNTSGTLQIITQELLDKAKDGKEIQLADVKIPLSDPSVMRRLHSTISVALTKAAIKIKVDGSLNVLCPSFGIVKVYNGKMRENYLNDSEITKEQEEWNKNPLSELINRVSDIKLGRTYKVEYNDGTVVLKHIRTTTDYYKLKEEIGKLKSIKEQFASTIITSSPKHTLTDPLDIESLLKGSIDKKIETAKKLGLDIDEDYEPRNLEELISRNLPKISSDSYKKEFGIKNFVSEGKLGYISNTNGISIWQASELIFSIALDLGFPVEDDLEIRNIIIDFISNYTPTQLKNYIKENRLQEALNNYRDLYQQEENFIEENTKSEFFEGGRELASYNITFSGEIQPNDLSRIYVTGNPSTTKLKALEIGGIDTLRHPDANGMHFGNPFSHLEKEVKEGRAKILTPTVREAVQAFELWLDGTNYQDVEPERRLWILNQINNGSLSGKTLVYYTNTVKDSEGTHYYNSKTFPNHAQVLQRRINERYLESIGPLFQLNLQTASFNLYDLVSVRNLHNLKESKTATKEQINDALAELQKDLMVLHSKNGQVLTDKGLVEINPQSVLIEPYEIVLPKIFATVFGLNTEDDLESIKRNPNFFLERLFDNIKPTHNNYTLALQRINGNHIYILNSNDAVLSDNFKPKEFNKIRENGKLYRQIEGDLEYELGENDLIWEYVSADGNAYEVIVTDDPTSYLDRVDYVTLNINLNLIPEKLELLISELRKSENKYVINYIAAIDKMLTEEGETIQSAIEDVQEVGKYTYRDSPLGYWYENLGKQIYASFLKSLEIVAARIPAQSMLSFMPMKVVGFEKSDRNTAYVSTVQFLFLGSDLDIDAVSLASFAFDKSGRYIIHSPLANIYSYELLKESLKIPFPTGVKLDFNYREVYDYNSIIRTQSEKELRTLGLSEQEIQKELDKPFYMTSGNLIVAMNLTSAQIRNLSKFIEYVNKLGYLPSSEEFSELAVGNILGIINRHNNYINTSRNVKEFSKNYIVSAMYDIGISPANLIESQQAMDSITNPLKEIGNSTEKAKSDSKFLSNPANFTTNIRGLVLNMDGKQGVGICAVGLKGFFAATARYNEVLANGTPEEVERLKSDVKIAGKHFRMLANAYSTNEVSSAILGEILTLLDLGTDSALILSGLLSLATDNAKELLLSKLNAANMLGMYIYGITIGMDFREIAKIIASKTGQIIDSLSKDDIVNGNKGMSMENIFDYLELGPTLNSSTDKIPKSIKDNYTKILFNKNFIRDLAWNHIINETKLSKYEIILYLNDLKVYPTKSIDPEYDTYDGTVEYNRNIEKLIDYVELVDDIISDGDSIYDIYTYFNRVGNDGRFITPNQGICGELKKLYLGGEEMRRLGLMLHINQGNETSYTKSLNYIDTIESAISSAQYRKYRERSRREQWKGNKRPDDYSKLYEFNFHKFVFDSYYREGVIDLYDGKCNKEFFERSESYREPFLKKLGKNIPLNVDEQYNSVTKQLYPSKTFLNTLDILQVPHYMEYIKSADMLHQLMQNSIKYRSIYKLGKRAIEEIGAYSLSDREKIFRRTEEYIDRLIRDRFFIYRRITFNIPIGQDYFIGPNIERITAKEGAQIKLGTREGNASFKLLMETAIIPELKRNPEFKDNKFILSLGPVSFSFSPEHLTIIGYAPNINMSPRSESDRALFEEIKYDFNRLRTTNYKYLSGGIRHDLIDLFFYYNLITFGGRVGENTLTNIFQDVLDYRNIKNFRDFETEQDKHGNFKISDKENGLEGNISLNTLIREVAPRAIKSSTNLNYFYDEDYITGKLSFYEKNKTRSFTDDSGRTIKLPKYSGITVDFTTDEDYKNYIVSSSESDIYLAHFNLKSGQKVQIKLQKGSITEIFVNDQLIQIPLQDENFFKKLPIITKITPEGIIEKYYNKNLIISKIEEIVSCKL